MAFDLTAALSAATQVATSNQQEGRKDLPKLIYPGKGELLVKLLFNPKANIVTRSIKRHKLSGTNYTCLSMYGQECPICKAVENVTAKTGADLWQLKAKTRGLAYAQYVGSNNYQWEQGREPEIGELVLLMFPWSVYQDINRLISSSGVNAGELIAKNNGKIFSIVRQRENGREQYKVSIDAFKTYRSISTSNGDEADELAFEKYLTDLPDLSTAIVKADCTDEIIQASKSAAETFLRENLTGVSYQAPTTQTVQNQATTTQYTTQQQPIQQPSYTQPQNLNQAVNQASQQLNQELPFQQVSQQPTPSVATGEQLPTCFKNHQDGSPQCMSCPHEIKCMMVQ